ncbi:response regulator [Aureicoccus marinus]|uniref:response regulator n=1 Tax=Aureicoccus marinus TaxID=754435 RepID=UPI001FE3E242|nr:response regulator [Aureicoccus marinus]
MSNTILLITNQLRRLLPALLLLCLLIPAQAQDLKKIDYKQISIDSLHRRALVQQHQNKGKEAFESLEHAAMASEKQEDLRELIDTYHLFARFHLENGDLDSADFYIQSARIRLGTQDYRYGSAYQAFLSARRSLYQKNYYQAAEFLEKVKGMSNERNLLNHITLANAEVLYHRMKYDEAETQLNALLINSDPIERTYLATKANLWLARLMVDKGKIPESIEAGQNALQIAKSKGYPMEEIQAYEILKNSYSLAGSYKSALSNSQALLDLTQSKENAEKEKQAAIKSAERITLQDQAKEMRFLEEENAKLNQSASRSEITAILTSAFLTIISLLAVSLYRNNQIKLKTNDLLHTKNKELETARDSAISAMKAKANFLSTVTHELRTPLYAVTGLTHLLLEENPSDHQKEHLKSLKFSGDYLLNFINDILQINKIDADKLEPLNIEFKLKKVLTDVIDSLQSSAKDTNTTVSLEYDPNIPLNLLGDPLKLSQIFMNLVGNALKFTRDGKVEVIAQLKKKGKEHVMLYFEVSDSGIGISEEQQQTIFESFEQGSVQINREYGGTGLGLTIVKSLLGLFGSRIELESELGVGSSFYFDLKVNCEENAITEEEASEQAEDEFDFTGLHVLIVEDNKINQVITKKMLTKKEMTCDIANNGNEAIDAAKSKHYDAILMDIHMPGISGDEATRQIRKFNTNVPIIALTAISMDDSVDAFYAAGCNAVVTKPFKPEVSTRKLGKMSSKRKHLKKR